MNGKVFVAVSHNYLLGVQTEELRFPPSKVRVQWLQLNQVSIHQQAPPVILQCINQQHLLRVHFGKGRIPILSN